MLAQTDADAAFKMGHTVGMFVGALLPFIFLAMAVKTISKEDHNRKCALSISAVMAGWSISGVGYLISQLTGATTLAVIAGVMAALLCFAGAGLAILGLIEAVGSKPPEGGAWQAVTTLVVGGLVVIAAFIGFVSGGKSVPKDWQMPQPPAGSRVSVVDKNFSLAVPGSDWVQVVALKLNPRADAAFVNPRKGLYYMVLAHRVPAGGAMQLDRFTEAARGELKGVDPGAVAGKAEPKTMGPYAGMAFTIDAKVKGQSLTYYEWLYVQGPVAYQIVSWSSRSDAALLRSEAVRITSGFETLTP